MRLIDGDALMPELESIREAEHQIYGKESWGFASKCITAIEDAPTIESESCEDAVSINAVIQKLNTMDRYVSEELRLCDTDKKFPKNEVFIVDDVYEEIVENLPSAQPDVPEINVGNINKFIDSLEEIFADLRERHGDDSVCGLCEYDGAYIGQSGDWCNECPGFDRDDCFKLSDKCRKRWIDTITKALPPAQPEPQWIPCSERLPEMTHFTQDVNPFSDDVLVTIRNEYGSKCLLIGFFDSQHGWLFSDQQPIDGFTWKPIAWQPLPDPYKKEGDRNE